MSRARAWNLPAVVLAATTLAIVMLIVIARRGAALTFATNEWPSVATPRERPNASRRRIEHSTDPPVFDTAEARGRRDLHPDVRAELAALGVREVLYQHALEGTTGDLEGVTFDFMMERLRADEATAAAILDDWIGRYGSLDKQDVDASAWLFDAYAELRGAEAIPALRALSSRAGVLPALIRAGSRDELDQIDAAFRDARSPTFLAPHVVAQGGPLGLAYVRRWVSDEAILAERRRAARVALWFYGTPGDRADLWERASAGERVDDLCGDRPGWPVDWDQRRRDACRAGLADASPRVRMRAEHFVLSQDDRRDPDLHDAAIERERIDAHLPNPGGHDPQAWESTQLELRGHVDVLDRDTARRALLGLD